MIVDSLHSCCNIYNMPFNVIIVGTGIAGLSAAITLSEAGHSVTIVEATSKLQAIGGILILQASANRLLDQLGVYSSILDICSTDPVPGGIRRYQDGDWLMQRKASAHTEEFGYPYVHFALSCALLTSQECGRFIVPIISRFSRGCEEGEDPMAIRLPGCGGRPREAGCHHHGRGGARSRFDCGCRR